MTALLSKAIQRVQELPNELQDEIAEQLLEDMESELRWQQTLAKPQTKLEKLAEDALLQSKSGKTRKLGFDDL